MKRQYIDWIKSYLNSSKQHVRYSEGTAPSEQIKYGVPQGSILGPLYFLYFLISSGFKYFSLDIYYCAFRFLNVNYDENFGCIDF